MKAFLYAAFAAFALGVTSASAQHGGRRGVQCYNGMVADRSNRRCVCPKKGSVAVQLASKMPESNGCSTMGIKVGGEEDFTSCCDLHDACYQTCGMAQKKCDQDFGDCMKDLCKSVFSHNPQCEGAANMYVMGVSMFGGGGFAESQHEYCECKEGTTVGAIAHYKDLFAKFYKDHTGKPAEEAEAKALGVMGKSLADEYSARSLKKAQKTFLKLMAKYPQSIRHVLGRVGRQNVPYIPEEYVQKKRAEQKAKRDARKKEL